MAMHTVHTSAPVVLDGATNVIRDRWDAFGSRQDLLCLSYAFQDPTLTLVPDCFPSKIESMFDGALKLITPRRVAMVVYGSVSAQQSRFGECSI